MSKIDHEGCICIAATIVAKSPYSDALGRNGLVAEIRRGGRPNRLYVHSEPTK